MITIYWNNSQRAVESLEVQEYDSSYRTRGLMQRPQMVLKFSLPRYVNIPTGAYCTYQGETYTLNTPADIKKNGTRIIEYTLKMGTYQDNLTLYKMRNSVDGRLKYSMCSTPAEYVAEIVANLNAREGSGVWHVGDCIDTTPKTIEFNHTSVDAALAQVAEEFGTEWEIVDHYIHLHTVKYNEDSPLPLSYGRGNGFVPGVGRTTPSGATPIKRLYVQGGERNIDRSQYGSQYLLLPTSQTIRYDGEKFEGESGFDSGNARTYQSSSDGCHVERTDRLTDSAKEDSIDCSDIYPSRVGTVSSVVVVNADKHFYDVVDSSIPASLDYDVYLIPGETMTIIFQTGMLAGKEFDVTYDHDGRRFEIVPQEIDGQTMPNATFTPAVSDTYAIFGCMLPSAYICDNRTKTGASWDMFKAAVRYLYANEDLTFTFSGKLQAKWARDNWATVGPKLVVGGYIHFFDDQFAPQGADVRITSVKDFLTDPYAPSIDISNGIAGQSITTTLVQVGCQEVMIGEAYGNAIGFAKRRYRDAKETLEMLSEAVMNYTEAINPITVQTMAMLVGDESLQFVLMSGDTVMTLTDPYNEATKRVVISACTLKHMTLGISSIMNVHNEDYRQWSMDAFTSSTLSDGSKSYYLYAKCGVGSDTGVFVLSQSAIGMQSVSGYYHFLVGILNSEYEDNRSWVPMYGFTEVLPGRINTDMIVSNDGQNWFDLVNGHIQANSAYIRGTMRSPFHDASDDLDAYQKYDNIYFADTSGHVPLSWDASQSGRKICICGSGIVDIEDGKYIYDDGVPVTEPFVFREEILTLLGYGDEEDFFGWILMDRRQYSTIGSTWGAYGKPFKALMYGHMSVTNEVLTMGYSAFDGSSITATRELTGVYSIVIPWNWFGLWPVPNQALAYCFVMVTPLGNAKNVRFATMLDTSTTPYSIKITFVVYDSDNVTLDGEFNFIIYNANQWGSYGL